MRIVIAMCSRSPRALSSLTAADGSIASKAPVCNFGVLLLLYARPARDRGAPLARTFFRYSCYYLVTSLAALQRCFDGREAFLTHALVVLVLSVLLLSPAPARLGMRSSHASVMCDSSRPGAVSSCVPGRERTHPLWCAKSLRL